MLAGRIISVAKDLIDDYKKFTILEKLNEAVVVTSQRATHPQNYAAQAKSLREWAKNVTAKSPINKYSPDILEFIINSSYYTATPERIAHVILNGFPINSGLAISSGEIQFYIQLGHELINDLTQLQNIYNKFNIEQIVIPTDAIAFDVVIPRASFENRSSTFLNSNLRFSRVMSYLIELTTGSKDEPLLVYTSTSDPVTGFALYAGAAYAFLNFYKLILEIAEKQLSLMKAIREFRKFAPESTADTEDRVQSITEEHLRMAIEGTISYVPIKVTADRVNEIKVALTRDAREITHAITSGTRVGVTVESIDRLPLICTELPNVSMDSINQLLAEQRRLELDVQQSHAALGQAAPILLPRETGFDEQKKK